MIYQLSCSVQKAFNIRLKDGMPYKDIMEKSMFTKCVFEFTLTNTKLIIGHVRDVFQDLRRRRTYKWTQ